LELSAPLDMTYRAIFVHEQAGHPETEPSRRQNALDPGLHGARTHCIQDFTAFLLPRTHPDRDADGAGVS
jgi:hypothetical protein